ncbi:MAG TPA: adenylate/guanylate cyclase domain-containing protein [Candidatus Binatia bacterium]|jgi:class 3 adenylate cyclase/tetratricopeptide (TPR) repeat protein
MQCAACGQSNPSGSRFCNACGAALAPAVAAERARPDTPAHLAERILSGRSALEGERKQVTVLFADVKGSMDLAERVDAEEWHAILDRFFRILTEGVHRFEGTVNQYTGDGIMALFGAPLAHEDHALRACAAALHLRDEVRRWADELRTTRGLAFAVRMGLNSGEVVVGRIGDDLKMDYTALGHTVGLAQRMEQLAEPGKPLLTEYTAGMVTGFFDVRDLGPSQVKGAAEPIRLYELAGVGRLRTRLDASRARGLSRFVGRGTEMAVLDAALERALAGEAQIVGVVGEAGIGKSRLCHEFAERCRARGITFIDAQAVPHGKAIPLLPWMDFTRKTFGIGEQDDDEMARQKIAGRLLLSDPGLRETLPIVFQFLGVSDPARPAPRLGPEAIQRELAEMHARLLRMRAERGEFWAVLFEDLHWFDPASEALLATLEELARDTATLALMTFRPGYDASWMRGPGFRRLAIAPLGPEALAELSRDLLGGDPSVAPLVAQLPARTGGNPFFIEEVVRTLVEAGSLVGTRGAYRLARPVEQLLIPPTVQGVLAARIDRLPACEKALLQTAAVVGREVPHAVLRRIVDLSDDDLASSLRALVDADFVYESGLPPDVEYVFKHALTQEVAYNSQLGEQRARIHGAVARAIEDLHPDRLEERAALLAHHWEGARDASTAARWHVRAADWVAGRDRSQLAQHWRRVRELLATVPETQETLALRVRACRHLLDSISLGSSADFSTMFDEGMTLAERLDDPSPRVRLLNVYANSLVFAGRLEEAEKRFRESLRLADASGDQFLRFLSRVPLTRAFVVAGHLTEALAASTEAEALGRALPELESEPGLSPYGLLLVQRGRALTYSGQPAEGARTMDRAIELARARQERELIAFAHLCRVMPSDVMGETEEQLAHARRAFEAAEAAASTFLHALALSALGQAHIAGGRWGEALEALGELGAGIRAGRVAPLIESETVALLAEAQLGAGDVASARATADAAVEIARRYRRRLSEIRGHLARARALAAGDGGATADEARAAIAAGRALVERTGAVMFEPFLALAEAELAERLGDATARRRALDQAERGFAAMGATARAAAVVRQRDA